MASSSRLCSDEELQKARDDLKELLVRSPIPDEFRSPGDEEEKEKKVNMGKKKKLYVLPQEYVEMLLNYKCRPLPKHEALAQAEEEDKEKYKDIRTLVTVANVLSRHYDDIIHDALEKMRHDFETKGYITYEATDDEEAMRVLRHFSRVPEDNNEGATASQQGPRGRGRRRHRPGVMKHTRGVKKLN
ncbi:uncharacterized protein LOC133886963 [Phragmites australis]|uniref:uncharacterized protein LOC133886963 n=1 Tax=Phragmites australis TaxID=29695 RepID=UPI002D769F84|nr:uncharacterized protein LOC133886963 [Phragmites australis]